MLKGLGNLANIATLVKQAQQMGAQMNEVSEQMKRERVSGSTGGGMVTVEATGLGEVLHCRIDPALFAKGDRELVEDMIPAAINEAQAKARELYAERVRSLGDTAGLGEMLSRLMGGAGDAAS